MLNVVLRLRRDNEFNYNKIKDSFIPANGEICLIDTPRDGLRAVCGDGVSVFGELPYVFDFIEKGYYKEGSFYIDQTYSQKITAIATKIYIDLNTSYMYYLNGSVFEPIDFALPTATASQAGVLKLYDELGYNTDGTMTQKAITEELEQKVEVSLKEEEELVIFSL